MAGGDCKNDLILAHIQCNACLALGDGIADHRVPADLKLVPFGDHFLARFATCCAQDGPATCFVEQKNYSVIRQAVGYARFDTKEELRLLQELYSKLRLLVNHFYPSVKLIDKTRVGSRVIKRYDKAKTPYRRLLECETLDEAIKEKLRSEHRRLRPMTLKKRIMQIQDELYKSASRKRYWPIDTHENEEDHTYDDKNLEDFV